MQRGLARIRQSPAIALIIIVSVLSGCVAAPLRPPNPLSNEYRADMRIGAVRVINASSDTEVAEILSKAVQGTVSPKFQGAKEVDLEITIDHYQDFGAATALFGGANVLATYTEVRETASGKVLAAYPVTVTFIAAGLFTAMVQGGKQGLSARAAEFLGKELARDSSTASP